MNATHAEIRRALEIVMANLKFDRFTADALKWHHATQCDLAAKEQPTHQHRGESDE